MYIVGSKAVNPPDVSQSDDNPLRVSKKANRHDFYEIATVSTLLLSLQRHKTTTPPTPFFFSLFLVSPFCCFWSMIWSFQLKKSLKDTQVQLADWLHHLLRSLFHLPSSFIFYFSFCICLVVGWLGLGSAKPPPAHVLSCGIGWQVNNVIEVIHHNVISNKRINKMIIIIIAHSFSTLFLYWFELRPT